LILSDLHIDAAAGEGDTCIAVLRCDGFVAAAAPGAEEEERGVDGDGDVDGDLDPPRKRRRAIAVRVEHALATPLADVGLQIWRGALLVADELARDVRLPSRRVAELGAGTGAAALAAAALGARSALATDGCAAAVSLAARNAARNGACVETALLDWGAYAADGGARDALGDADLLIAADCVYDDDATEALFDAFDAALARNPRRVLLLALEMRFNFELESLSVRAHGYRTLRRRLDALDAVRLPLPPRVWHYDRGDEAALELWRVSKRDPGKRPD